jgi:hypothetical protein
LFGRANQGPVATAPEIVEIKEEIIEIQPIAAEVPQPPLVASVKEQITGMAGKFKSLFGQDKHTPIAKEPDVIEIKEEILKLQPAITEVAIPAVLPINDPVVGVTERFKNLFGRANPEPIATAPETVEIKEEIVAVEPELPVVELPSVSPVKAEMAGVTGKLKGLFGKAK